LGVKIVYLIIIAQNGEGCNHIIEKRTEKAYSTLRRARKPPSRLGDEIGLF
jgi:hypothetical protein